MFDNKHMEDIRKILYNYKSFKCILADKYKLIEEIEQYGLPKHSGSVSICPIGTVSDSKDDTESEYINTLQHQIKSLERHLEAVDNALNTIKCDKYYKIIEYKYFNKMSCREIGKIFYLDKSNICRQDKRLLKELEKCLFYSDATNSQP